jgi:hypothetical protein
MDIESVNGEEQLNKYFAGLKNKSIRYYFYMQRGLGLLNEMRYLIMAIFGVYLTFKMSNPMIMVIMFIVSIPILCILGYISVIHMGKVMDYLQIKFSTVWGKYGYELQEEIIKQLKDIKDKLK